MCLHHAFFSPSLPWILIYGGLVLGENKGRDKWLLVWSPLPCLDASTWQMFKAKYFIGHYSFLEASRGTIQEQCLWYGLGGL